MSTSLIRRAQVRLVSSRSFVCCVRSCVFVRSFATKYLGAAENPDDARTLPYTHNTAHFLKILQQRKGVKVFVVDTGIRWGHEEFGPNNDMEDAPQYSRITCGFDAYHLHMHESDWNSGCYDGVGHGTHVAGIIGGNVYVRTIHHFHTCITCPSQRRSRIRNIVCTRARACENARRVSLMRGCSFDRSCSLLSRTISRRFVDAFSCWMPFVRACVCAHVDSFVAFFKMPATHSFTHSFSRARGFFFSVARLLYGAG